MIRQPWHRMTLALVALALFTVVAYRLRYRIAGTLADVAQPAVAATQGPDSARFQAPRGTRTVTSVLRAVGPAVKEIYAPICQKNGIAWPPQSITLIALKDEKMLEVWAANSSKGPYKRIATCPIRAASGELGPKRREGDLQVPEGFYQLDSLNPNSRFHLSLHVNYPNAEDRRNRLVPHAPLGGDIMVHGNAVSIGCIAIGDRRIEEVFSLVAWVDTNQRHILIAPVDLRTRSIPNAYQPWITDMYKRLAQEMRKYR